MGPKIMHQYYFEGSLYCSYGIIPPSPILMIQAPLRVLGFRVLPLGPVAQSISQRFQSRLLCCAWRATAFLSRAEA